MNVEEIYRIARARLRIEGWDEDEARVTARVLCDEAVGAPYSHLLRPDVSIANPALQMWHTRLNKVARGAPLAYVLGRREFFRLEFHCDERALIPRPETELLVETALEKLKDHPAPRVADLGTGSGAIAVSLAVNLPSAQVWATDISSDALQLAQTNALRYGVGDRINLVAGQRDQWAAPLEAWLAEVRSVFPDSASLGSAANQREAFLFDAILSNPPYIAREEIEDLQTQIRDFEPRTALDGGDDGLDCYRQLAVQCGPLLKNDGFLAVELGAGQFNEVRQIFIDEGWSVEAPRFDLQNIARVLVAQTENP